MNKTLQKNPTLYSDAKAGNFVASKAVNLASDSDSFNWVAAFSHSGFKFLQCPHP